MPIINSTDKVLVTGANGYIALWIVKTLLERGNSVRAAVRSESKGTPLQELFKSYGSKLEITIVPDMTKEGAWDEAVKGVQAIEHTATPANFFVPDPKPEDFIQPAINGTLRVLESALKHQEGIKRIVVTSSISAVANATDPPRHYTEDDWNESSLKEVEEKGSEAGVQTIYAASKVLAERAATDFYKKHKDEVSWDLTVICPPLVIGAPLGEVPSQTALNTSLQFYWMSVIADVPRTREQLTAAVPFADVRDMAEAHVLALEKEKAAGERIFITCGTYVWQDLIDLAVKVAPSRKVSPGMPELDRSTKGMGVAYEKSIEILGMKYRSLEDTTRYMLDDFAKRGF